MNPTVQAALITGIFLLGVTAVGLIARSINRAKPTAPKPPADLEVPELWQMWLEIKSQQGTLTKLETEFSNYKSAASRYFEKLASKWPGPNPMPEPDEADKEILELTLSRIPRRKPKDQL